MNRLKSLVVLTLILSLGSTGLAAEERSEDVEADATKRGDAAAGMKAYPLAQYEQVFLTNRTVVSPSVGLIITTGDEESPNELVVLALYSAHLYEGGLEFGYPDLSHEISGIFSARHGRHRWIGLFVSESDRPVAGGLPTFKTGAIYGYDVVSAPDLSLMLGGGAVIGDFGIDLSDGSPLPILPVPFVRFTTKAPWLETKFEFLSGPDLSLAIAPRSPLGINAELRMDSFDSIRDLIFDASLVYRPFIGRVDELDFINFSVGISNSELTFYRSEGSYKLQSYDAYGKLDLGVLQLRLGYAFDSRETYGGDTVLDAGTGMTVSIQGVLPLGGR